MIQQRMHVFGTNHLNSNRWWWQFFITIIIKKFRTIGGWERKSYSIPSPNPNRLVKDSFCLLRYYNIIFSWTELHTQTILEDQGNHIPYRIQTRHRMHSSHQFLIVPPCIMQVFIKSTYLIEWFDKYQQTETITGCENKKVQVDHKHFFSILNKNPGNLGDHSKFKNTSINKLQSETMENRKRSKVW